MSLLIENVRLVRPGIEALRGSVLVRGDCLAAVNPEPGLLSEDTERVDGQGRLLTPGCVDVHTHGVGRLQYQEGAEPILEAARVLPRYGTTCFLPTIVPQPGGAMLAELVAAAKAVDAGDGARVGGLHVEGPFMAETGAACDTVPGDLGLLEEIVDACRGGMRVMSVSPDTPHIVPVIERLREHGVSPFITHTRADVEQTQRAIEAGARHATHFYDVFHLPSSTEAGVRPVGAVEVILADPRVTVDFICDGVHVHPVAIQAALAAKGCEGISLITDSNIGAGLPPGRYETPWGYAVRVREDDAVRIDDPHHRYYKGLAGSSLTMDRAVRNAAAWLSPPVEHLWAMATANPARAAGLTELGRLEPGAPADLVLWDEEGRAARSWVRGRTVFEST